MGESFKRLTVLGIISVLALLQAGLASAQSAGQNCPAANPDTAIAYCTVIIETETSNFLVLGNAHNNRALAYARKGDYDHALRDFAQAIKYRPDSAVPYNNRCYALAELAKLDDALADCQMAVRLDPRNSGILDSRGFVYVLMGKHAEAIRDYNSALDISPKLASSLFGRAVAKLKSGNSAGAATDFAAVNPDIAKTMAAAGLTVDVVDLAPKAPTAGH